MKGNGLQNLSLQIKIMNVFDYVIIIILLCWAMFSDWGNKDNKK